MTLRRFEMAWPQGARATVTAIALYGLTMAGCGCTRREPDQAHARTTSAISASAVSAPAKPATPSAAETLPELRAGRALRNLFGVSSKFAQGEPQSDLALLTELGVKWVRDSVPWHVMEPHAGRYIDFPREFQQRLEFYKAHDMGLVFMLAYDNYIAYARTASSPAAAFEPVAYGRWAVEVAKRLRQSGVRFVLELWNEPHNMVLRPVLGGSWNGAPPSPWVQHYVRMVHETVKQVKAFDASIRVIDDDDMWVVHYWFLEAGLPTKLDGFAFHPYVEGVPERAAVDQKTQWVAPFIAVDPDGSFKSAVRRLRERGQAKLAKEPEMWITEWGWPVGDPGGQPKVFSEDAVAAWLPRAFVLAEAAGVEALCWFSTQDNADGPMGLTDNRGHKRKTYYAYKFLNEALGDYTLSVQIAGEKHQTAGAQAYLFHRGSRAKLIAWSIEPAVSWLELDGPLKSAQLSGNLGKPVVPVRGVRGGNWIELGAAPVYLEFELPNGAIELNIAESNGIAPP